VNSDVDTKLHIFYFSNVQTFLAAAEYNGTKVDP
jgi:hypothetical protein